MDQNTPLLEIDGSRGEGGGQIVRSALALSMVTGQPFRIERIRAGRDKPGLLRQHLTAVHAAQELCGAEVTGDSLRSSSLTFRPSPIVPGEYSFAIGTAGSTTLVLQTLLPPLLNAAKSSRLIIEGGTHNPWAPPFDFLQKSYFRVLQEMGPRITATLDRHGFFPAGGGRIVVDIEPSPALTGFDLLERGAIRQKRAMAKVCNLPEHIAERELAELQRLADWEDDSLVQESVAGLGPGNVVLIEVDCEHVTEVFVALGQQGVKAEVVAGRALDEMQQYLASGVPVGPYLGDQLLLPFGLAVWQAAQRREYHQCSFRTGELTDHSRSHIEILKTFLGIDIHATEADASGSVTVTLAGTQRP